MQSSERCPDALRIYGTGDSEVVPLDALLVEGRWSRSQKSALPDGTVGTWVWLHRTERW